MSANFVDGANTGSARPRWALIVAVVAGLFGILTVLSGGRALFRDEVARAVVGNAVSFVLWFNFIAGFLYVIAGIGFVLWRRWVAHLSLVIATATLVVFAAFGWHMASGGAFEVRTVGAMILRSGIWIAIAISACRALGCWITKNA